MLHVAVPTTCVLMIGAVTQLQFVVQTQGHYFDMLTG